MDKELEELAAGRGKSRRDRDHKRDGEAAEAAFLSKATSLGFEVAKPWGDSSRFDFIVHTGSRCWRVQVKSTLGRGPYYKVKTRGNSMAYAKDSVDFLVAYIVSLNTWYVLPIELVCSKTALSLFPRRGSKSRFELYREAWCLMACPRDARCNPEITVWRRCLATENGECPFHGSGLAAKLLKDRAGKR